VLSHEDTQLIEEFLAMRKRIGLSPEAVEQIVDGEISGATIRKYEREGLPSRIESSSRIAMKAFIQKYSNAPQVVRERSVAYAEPDFSDAELWLQSILAADSLRRMVRTVEGRQVIKGLRGVIADLDWPSEKKKAADRLLTDALLDDSV
jgi:hypothetical protein